MADFTMQHYQNRYQEAEIKANRAKERVDNLKSALASGAGDLEALYDKLQAAEEDYRAAQEAADELEYLATYGKTRAELQQGQGMQWRPMIGGLVHTPHYPESPRGGRLPH